MPRLTQEQKQLNHDRIIEAAGRGFRTHGVNGIGIAELMKAAEMTHGGFYNHFDSKDDLALEVIRQGFVSSLSALGDIREEHPGSARAALDHMFDQYLSVLHRDQPEYGCASAAWSLMPDATASRPSPSTSTDSTASSAPSPTWCLRTPASPALI